MAQGNAQQNPIMAGFKNLMNMGGNRNQQQQGPGGQRPVNGPSSQNNPIQSQNDPKQFKFDPMTGAPIKNGSTNNPETQTSPLDAYQGLWGKAKGPDGKEIEPEVPPAFNIDQKAIDAAAGSLSFSGNIPEDMDLSGLGENKDTILALMDHVGRQAYATAINHSSKLTDKWYNSRSAHDAKAIPNIVKDSLTYHGIENMPFAQKSPVVRENMKMIGKQLRGMYPDATPEQIQERTVQFFNEMAKAINPDMFQQQEVMNQERARQPGGEEFDWDDWLKTSARQQQQQAG